MYVMRDVVVVVMQKGNAVVWCGGDFERREGGHDTIQRVYFTAYLTTVRMNEIRLIRFVPMGHVSRAIEAMITTEEYPLLPDWQARSLVLDNHHVHMHT